MTCKTCEEYFQPKCQLLLIWKVKPLDEEKKKKKKKKLSFKASKCSIFDCNWKVHSEPKIEDVWLAQHSPIWKAVHSEKQFSPVYYLLFQEEKCDPEEVEKNCTHGLIISLLWCKYSACIISVTQECGY